ncbi:MAG: class I SAM-dependent methyltransferase [Gemmatimonadetes bacterium]|nr:class I SAM-dependent methyltransferase [Gemmatimonadota bacterium]
MTEPTRDVAGRDSRASETDSFETSPEYWDSVGAAWHARPQRAWRVVSDRVNVRLIDRWFGTRVEGKVLKTDLFDEVVGGGLADRLAASFDQVVGIDISPAVVEVVRQRHPHLQAEVADVRELPFADGSFSAVVSNSTLDHFDRTDDIERALGELHRVLAPGGRLLVTFDNPGNPIVGLRNTLPRKVLAASRMVPYAVGATLDRSGLDRTLDRLGFDIVALSACWHSPRFLVVLGGHGIDRLGWPWLRRAYTRAWSWFEVLERLPTRFLTGHFVVALAEKRP